jgi:YggT family protein
VRSGWLANRSREAAKVGGARRDRTADLLIANEALSQLSYGPYRGRASARSEWAPFTARGRESQECFKTGDLARLFAAGRPATFRCVPTTLTPPMRSILYIILLVLDLYIWLLIAAAVLSWLVAFNVVNTRNQFVSMVGDFLWRITEPVLRPIRNFMPSLGGIDVSPVVLILLIILLKDLIIRYIYPNVF